MIQIGVHVAMQGVVRHGRNIILLHSTGCAMTLLVDSR